jgi:flagellar basal-body rod protein FlgB
MTFLNATDRVGVASLNFRSIRDQVIHSNVVNAETPGFRALGYDFEDQLKAVLATDGVHTTQKRHLRHEWLGMNGDIDPDVYVRPSESVGNDGNTVDLDKEMGELAHNHLLFRTTLEGLSRKIGMIKYAIDGGR